MQNKLLTAKQLAAELAVSVAAIRTWTRFGMPCDRLGRRCVRFNLQEVLDWFKRRQQDEVHHGL